VICSSSIFVLFVFIQVASVFQETQSQSVSPCWTNIQLLKASFGLMPSFLLLDPSTYRQVCLSKFSMSCFAGNWD